jgi:hypothetical protein
MRGSSGEQSTAPGRDTLCLQAILTYACDTEFVEFLSCQFGMSTDGAKTYACGSVAPVRRRSPLTYNQTAHTPSSES